MFCQDTLINRCNDVLHLIYPLLDLADSVITASTHNTIVSKTAPSHRILFPISDSPPSFVEAQL